jgi:hypothetical protein
MSITSDAPRAFRFDDDANPKLRPTWLISPAIDLLFLANLCWPMLFLLQFWGGFEARESVGFWQVYFVTAPHRWITLLIVFGDRELTQRFGRTFLTLFFLIVSLCLMVRFTTGATVASTSPSASTTRPSAPSMPFDGMARIP